MIGSDLTALLFLAGILLLSPIIIALWAFFRTTDNRRKSQSLETSLEILTRQVDQLKSQQDDLLAQLAGRPQDRGDERKDLDNNGEASAAPVEQDDEEEETPDIPDDIKQWQQKHPQSPDTPKDQKPPHTSVPLASPTPLSKSQTISPSARKQSMEQQVGAKWSVWLGGLALALGALFLVKHSIDQGYLTPAVRILLAIIMSAALLTGGEWIRRRDVLNNIAGVPGAYIPGVLTAAGIVAAFATIYATYALYHFISPLFAFLLLVLVALGALFASIIHGPTLAAMGLAGAYVTPALVSTGNANAWTLFTYLLFVSATHFIAAQMRSWSWLAISAVTASVAWGAIWFAGPWTPGDALPMSIYILGLMLLALPFLKQAEPKLAESQRHSLFAAIDHADLLVALALGSIGLLSVTLLRYADYSGLSLAVLAIIIGLFLSLAYRWLSLGMLSAFAAVLFGFAYLGWHIGYISDALGNLTYLWSSRPIQIIPPSVTPLAIDAVTPPQIIAFLTFGTLFSGAFAAVGFFLVRHHKGEPLFALVSTLTPLAAFTYAYWRVGHFDPSISFGIVGLALAGVAILATDHLDRQIPNKNEAREQRSEEQQSEEQGSKKHGLGRRYEVSAGIYATAAVAALALACTIVLDKGWLTIALATMTPALAVIARKRNMAVLGYLAGAIALLVAARLFYEPRIVGDLRGTLPILNWLLYGYGLPALALTLAASIFRKDRDDWVPDLLEAAAILFGTILIFLQIRHWMYDGNIYAARFNLVENGLQTSVWVALSLIMHKLHGASGRWVPEMAANMLGLLGLGSALLGLLLLNNPLFTGNSVGPGILLNDLLLGYLVPALLLALLLWTIHGERQNYYVKLVGAGAFALTFAYLSLQLRTLFQDGRLGITRPTSDPEWYAYSALWLLFGLALLGAGIYLRQQQLRLASLALIGLVIVKVFLSDMANLTGIWRALSFIGLGLALVGVGALYQRIIIPQDGQQNDGVEENDPKPL